ncbi:hypothetical protein V3C99_013857 [Haemonchus contortus]
MQRMRKDHILHTQAISQGITPDRSQNELLLHHWRKDRIQGRE